MVRPRDCVSRGPRLTHIRVAEYRIHNADVLFREDATIDEFIDVIEGNRKYIRCLYVYNKIDVLCIEEVDAIARQPYCVPISCVANLGTDVLLEQMWKAMDLRRVYTKKARFDSASSSSSAQR